MIRFGYFLKSPFFLFFLFFNISLSAEQYSDKKSQRNSSDKNEIKIEKSYLDNQAKIFLDTIQAILAHNPPSVSESAERGFAKLLIDAVFNEKHAPFRKPSQDFFHNRISKVAEELESTIVEDGARIWKLYNMGFIVRTNSVTLAFDFASGISSGSEEFAIEKKLLDRIINQCDALFISHEHEENAEKRIAQQFIQQGLPVFAPDKIWENEPIQSMIISPDRIAHENQKFVVNGKTLNVVTYPGHQMNEIECNVYLITTPENITISHLGDQVNGGNFLVDYEWIDMVKDHFKVDILMPNLCSRDLLRIVQGFDPELVLPSHESEHSNWTELPCWGDNKELQLNYLKLQNSDYQIVDMIWGESFKYYPNDWNTKRPFLELSNWH